MTEIKPAIECLCKLLVDYGFSYVPVENFRQAKFDREIPCRLLWNLLAELLISKQSNWIVSNQSENEELFNDQQKLTNFVKQSLINEGYSNVSNLSPDGGSRAILIAFGWFLAKTNFIDELMRLKIHETTSRWETKSFQVFKSSKMQELMKKSSNLNLKQLCDRLIWLFGKTKMVTRNLHDEYEEELRLTNKILSTSVLDLDKYSHLSTKLRLSLLARPTSHPKFIQMVKDDINTLNLFLKWKENEGLFWKWMVTVLNIQETTETMAKSIKITPEIEFSDYLTEKSSIKSFSELRKLNLIPIGPKTNNLKRLKELNDKLAQEIIELKINLNNKKEKKNEIVTELCSQLNGVICIQPFSFTSK